MAKNGFLPTLDWDLIGNIVVGIMVFTVLKNILRKLTKDSKFNLFERPTDIMKFMSMVEALKKRARAAQRQQNQGAIVPYDGERNDISVAERAAAGE